MFGVTVLGRDYPEILIDAKFELGEYIRDLAWAEECIVIAGESGSIWKVDTRTKQIQNILAQHQGGALALSSSRKISNLVASGGQDGQVHIIDVRRNQILFSVDMEKAWIELLQWNSSGNLLAAAVEKSVVIISKDGDVVNELVDHPSTISGMYWNSSSDDIALCHYGGVSLWYYKGSSPKRKLSFKGSVLSVAWQPNGKHIAVGSQDATAQFWNLKTGEQSFMSGYPTKIQELCWSSDSSFFATSGGPEVTVWSFRGKGPQGTVPMRLGGHLDMVTKIQFHPHKPILASGGKDGRVHLFNLLDGEEPIARLETSSEISCLKFSSDGSRLSFGNAEGEVFIANTI
jgi:WD40 repeat protein